MQMQTQMQVGLIVTYQKCNSMKVRKDSSNEIGLLKIYKRRQAGNAIFAT